MNISIQYRFTIALCIFFPVQSLIKVLDLKKKHHVG